MKRLGICFFILLLLAGCVSQSSYVPQLGRTPQSSYVLHLQTAKYAPGFEPERIYIDKISQRLITCILENDPLEDFWDKVILIPLETYIRFDDEWMSFLDVKAQEYVNKILPKCEDIIRGGFTQTGIIPSEKNYDLLRAEFIITCLSNLSCQQIQGQIFSELDQNIKSFFEPIFNKVKTEATVNQKSFTKALNETQHFGEYHNLIYKFALQEKGKLDLRLELDNKFAPILEAKRLKWFKSITEEQKNIFTTQNSCVQASPNNEVCAKKFLSVLTPKQYSFLEREVYQRGYLERERRVGDERISKLNNLARWIQANNDMAKASYYNQVQQEQLRAAKAQAFGMALLGFSSAMNAYNNWQQSYYNSYTVVGGGKNFQLFDQFGNYYYGRIN